MKNLKQRAGMITLVNQSVRQSYTKCADSLAAPDHKETLPCCRKQAPHLKHCSGLDGAGLPTDAPVPCRSATCCASVGAGTAADPRNWQ